MKYNSAILQNMSVTVFIFLCSLLQFGMYIIMKPAWLLTHVNIFLNMHAMHAIHNIIFKYNDCNIIVMEVNINAIIYPMANTFFINPQSYTVSMCIPLYTDICILVSQNLWNRDISINIITFNNLIRIIEKQPFSPFGTLHEVNVSLLWFMYYAFVAVLNVIASLKLGENDSMLHWLLSGDRSLVVEISSVISAKLGSSAGLTVHI